MRCFYLKYKYLEYKENTNIIHVSHFTGVFLVKIALQIKAPKRKPAVLVNLAIFSAAQATAIYFVYFTFFNLHKNVKDNFWIPSTTIFSNLCTLS